MCCYNTRARAAWAVSAEHTLALLTDQCQLLLRVHVFHCAFIAYSTGKEQSGDNTRDATTPVKDEEHELFVASSGSESGSSDAADTKRRAVVSRKRLQQKAPVNRPKAVPQERTPDDTGTTTQKAEAIIVLDSDSDDVDAISTTAAASTVNVAASQEKLEWECRKCTYLNETSSNVCEICTSPCPTRKLRNLSQWLAPAAVKRSSAASKLSAKGETDKKRKDPSFEVIDSSGGSDLESDDKTQARLGAASRLKNPSAMTVLTGPSAQSNALWADTYSPSTVEDLCVNKKKIQELSEWLNLSAWPLSTAANSVHARKRLLFLCGPPGSGKSTAVRCIARQMGLGVKEWDDNTSAGKLSYERMLQEQFWTHQTSGADDFMDFITRSISYAALPMAPAITGSERRNRKRKLPSSQGLPGTSSQPQAPSSQVILIENWPQNWSKPGSAWEDKVQKVFRLIVDPAGKNQFPVICIFSDVRENKIDPKHLAKLFSPEVMNSPFTSVMNFNGVTAGIV